VTHAKRIELLEIILAALIEHIDQVGCYTLHGERLGDQIPVVMQARMAPGDDARERTRGGSALEH
jgi:hypothetical protein